MAKVDIYVDYSVTKNKSSYAVVCVFEKSVEVYEKIIPVTIAHIGELKAVIDAQQHARQFFSDYDVTIHTDQNIITDAFKSCQDLKFKNKTYQKYPELKGLVERFNRNRRWGFNYKRCASHKGNTYHDLADTLAGVQTGTHNKDRVKTMQDKVQNAISKPNVSIWDMITATIAQWVLVLC